MARVIKATRVCLVCDNEFLGTPSATRCQHCKGAGLSVPRDRQKARAGMTSGKATPDPSKLVTRICQACGEDFETPRPKASRCPECIAEDRRVQRRTCLNCAKPFNVIDPSHVNCKSCSDLLGLEQWEMTDEQYAKMLAEERMSRWQEKLESQTKWLDKRERYRAKRSNQITHQHDDEDAPLLVRLGLAP